MNIKKIKYSHDPHCEIPAPSILVYTDEDIFRLDLNVNCWYKHVMVAGDSGAEVEPTEDERVSLLEALAEKIFK